MSGWRCSVNLLRVLDDRGVPLRDIPALAGISKSGLDMALGLASKARLVEIGKSPGGRGKAVVLTAVGLERRDRCERLATAIEDRWKTRFGAPTIVRLRELLQGLGGSSADASGLFVGLNPPADCWRAAVPRPGSLPHYPLVLHRGGFPDGA